MARPTCIPGRPPDVPCAPLFPHPTRTRTLARTAVTLLGVLCLGGLGQLGSGHAPAAAPAPAPSATSSASPPPRALTAAAPALIGPAVAAVPRTVRPPAVVPKASRAPRPVQAARRTAPAPPTPRKTATAPARRTPSSQPFTAAEADRRGREAFASIHKALPTGWRLQVEVYRGTNQGLADSGTRTVTLWVRPSDSQSALRITLAHELGHVLDYTALTDRDRQDYRELRGRGRDRSAWYPANGTQDYASPAGDFAEVYALWRGGSGDFRSTWAAQPDHAQLDRIVSLFRDLEARQT